MPWNNVARALGARVAAAVAEVVRVARIVGIAGAAVLGGCASSGDRASPAEDASNDRGTTWTGMLDEESFKALHELRGDAAPELFGETVEVGDAACYLSLPPGERAPLPGIVVIHEWWGLNDHVKHWTDRLARAGYAALAVDLYGGTVATTRDEAMAAMNAVDDAAALGVMQAAFRFLGEDPRIRASRRASIGWCFGGGRSLQLALGQPDLTAAVIYYGRLVDDPERLTAIRASLLGVFGDRDRGIPPEAVDRFEAGLKAAGVPHRILRYDADHAFANPSSARYDQDAATTAWREVQAFLAAHLVD